MTDTKTFTVSVSSTPGCAPEIAAASCAASASAATEGRFRGRQIVCADKGFILYGDVYEHNGRLVIRNGGTVRYYSEPNGGLERLAFHSPSDKTRLDPCAVQSIPANREIKSIDIVSGGI
jgi:hypothetical protein